MNVIKTENICCTVLLQARHLQTISCAKWQNFYIALFWFIQVRLCYSISYFITAPVFALMVLLYSFPSA